MKKKSVVAMLVMCMAFTAAACGSEKETKATAQETTDKKEETKADKKEAKEDTAEDTSKEDTSEKDSSDSEKKEAEPAKLVSVDDLSDYVTVGEYKGLKLDRITQSVTDDDVQAEIDYDLQAKGDEVKDGAAEGDVATINFTGTIDGEEFEDGSADDYELTIGEGSMIDGFEDGIVGMKPGETKELDLTFPDDYYEEDLAGKAVVFKVTLQKAVRKAELTEDWVTANTDYKSVDEYKASVKKNLEEQAAEAADSTLRDNAWSEVLSASEVKKYPEEDVNAAIDEYKASYETYIEEIGIEMSDFLDAQGMTQDDFDEQCKETAQARVEQNMIVQEIMNKEGLSIDNDADKINSVLYSEYGLNSEDEIKDAYYLSDQEIAEEKALICVKEFIVANATVEEKTGSEGDLIANEDAYDLDGGDEDLEYEILDEDGEEYTDEDGETYVDEDGDTSDTEEEQ